MRVKTTCSDMPRRWGNRYAPRVLSRLLKWLKRTPPDVVWPAVIQPQAVVEQQVERPPAEVVRLSSVLKALKQAKERLSEPELAALGVALAEALQSAPGRRLRGTSPKDLLLPREGGLRVLDSQQPSSAMAYFTPEMVRGRPLDVRSDVFNLGTLLWFAATLQHPFEVQGQSDFDLLNAILQVTTPVPLESLRDDLSPALLAVLRTALQRDPAERYQTLHAVLEVLRPLAGEYHPLVERAFSLTGPTRPRRVAMADDEMLDAVGRGDETARLVYADVLEERGLVQHARWLRLESKVQVAAGEEREALLKELAPLREVVGAEFLATVGRPAIERCELVFGFKCPLKWTELERTAKPLERYCKVCDSTVYFADSPERLTDLSWRGACVAVDVSVPRSPDEEDQVGVAVMGRVAPRRRRNAFGD
ncbi:MAG: hypothetical protein GQE15_37900 [Archangiaceae bacterium]|nr:hypothetical protein [Archangiaceae bacterium]